MTPLKTGLLALRMSPWALALPILKRVVSLRRLAEMMRQEGRGRRDRANEGRIVAVSSALARLRPPRFQANCLERSLLAYRFLTRANADVSIVVGVRTANGRLFGHAWVTVDGKPVHEPSAALSAFSRVVEFSSDGTASQTADWHLPDVWV
jgi:hypothetical protein